MGYDAIEGHDSLDAAVAQLAADAKSTEHVLVRNTNDGHFAGGDHDRNDPEFVAYHRLWLLLPPNSESPASIAVLMLKEYKPDASGKIDVAYKWISEECGPAVFDTCVAAWFTKAPEPTNGMAADWRCQVRRRAMLDERAGKARSRRAKRAAGGRP